MATTDQPIVEVKRRGRQAGDKAQVTIIKDPLLGKYYIEIKDKSAFNVMKEGEVKVVAHCSNFPSAVKRILLEGSFSKSETFTIKEYIQEFKDIFSKLNQSLNI